MSPGIDPKSNRAYWQPKLARTNARDLAHVERLQQLGYRGLIMWECSSRKPERAAEQIERFFEQVQRRYA